MEVIIKVLLILIIVGVFISFPVMWLWNGIMPDLFGVSEIGYWQAFGLYVLCNILFNSGD